MSRTFDDLWESFSVQVKEGNSYADILPPTKEILTLVFRLPMEVSSKLRLITEDLSQRYQGLYLYPANTIHTTVLFMSSYVPTDYASEADIQKLSEIIMHCFKQPLAGQVRGIGLFPTTVFSQIYLEGMEELRRNISNELKGTKYYTEKTMLYEEKLDWNLSFSNIVRFTEKVDGKIVEDLKKYRDYDLGEIVLTQAELVKTDKFLSEGGTTIYGKFTV